MGEEQDTPALRERQRSEYQLSEAQHARFRVLLSMPAAAWPEALQRRVLIAFELEGRTREAVEWAIADYVRRVVPKTT
ncbi:MAG TPA: hypothetical protein VGS80_11310 [Ktedonobacterales bacterium]|nr:hypothetical protein [Ktedonobacterales bacterium]